MKTLSKEEVKENFAVAAALTLNKNVHDYRFEVLDTHTIGVYQHFNIAMSGEHTETSHDWAEKLVKSDLLTADRIEKLKTHLNDLFNRTAHTLVTMTIIFLYDSRRFGFSIILSEKK